MQRWVYDYRSVNGEPAALADRLRRELPELLAAAVGHEPNAPLPDGSFMLEIPAKVAGVDAGKYVRVTLGVERGTVDRTVLPVRWRAEPLAHAFPEFEGTIELEPLAADFAQLTIGGAYRPPGGVLGAAVDAALRLRGVANNTLVSLLDGLTEALTDPDVTPAAPYDHALVHVGEIMRGDPMVLDDDMSLRTATLMLHHHKESGAPVVDGNGRLVGVITERDILEKAATPTHGLGADVRRAQRLHGARTVGEACTRPALVTSPDVTVHQAAREMLDRKVARLVVVDAGRLVGVVSRHDILGVLARDDTRMHAAARHLLVDMGESDVHVDVHWGRLRATGSVTLRSRVAMVIERLKEVDGISEVDGGHLGWRQDDVTFAGSAARS